MQVQMCIHCHETKPLSDFYEDERMRNGHLSTCKDCVRARARAHYRALPPEKKREINRIQHERRKRILEDIRGCSILRKT